MTELSRAEWDEIQHSALIEIKPDEQPLTFQPRSKNAMPNAPQKPTRKSTKKKGK